MPPTHLAEAEAPLCLSLALLAAAHNGPVGHLTSLLASTLQDYTTLLVSVALEKMLQFYLVNCLWGGLGSPS